MIDYRARNVQENRLSRVSLRDRKIIELLGRENSPAVVAEQFGMDPAEVVEISSLKTCCRQDIFTELNSVDCWYSAEIAIVSGPRATGQYDNCAVGAQRRGCHYQPH